MTWIHLRSNGRHSLDQLLTLLFSAAFGFVVLLLFRSGWLKVFVAPELRLYVVLAAFNLLTLVMVRAVLTAEAACVRLQGDSESSPADGGFLGDDYSPDPGWIPIRYIVLSVPLLLCALDMPIEYFGPGKDLTPALKEMTPEELKEAASDAEKRKSIEGKVVRVQGYLLPALDTAWFSLCRNRMVGQASILPCQLQGVPEEDSRLSIKRLSGWRVEAVGRVEFRGVQDIIWVPVLIIKPKEGQTLNDLLKRAEDPNPYL